MIPIDNIYRTLIPYNKNFPNTYITILPKELQTLLTIYYYDLLEIKCFYSNRTGLYIKKFNTNNKVESSAKIFLPIINLLADHNKNPETGFSPTDFSTDGIFWYPNYTKIT